MIKSIIFFVLNFHFEGIEKYKKLEIQHIQDFYNVLIYELPRLAHNRSKNYYIWG